MAYDFQRRALPAASILACIALTLPATAGAQRARGAEVPGWLQDRENAEGIGFRLGDLELHPGVGAEIGYDSNVFLDDQNANGSAILRVTPHLNLSTLGEQRRSEGDEDREGAPPMVRFRGGLSASFIHYFATEAKTNVGADLDLRLTIAPERPFSVTLFESFGRSVRPFTEQTGTGGGYARDQNTVGMMAHFATDGQIFRGGLGYSLAIDYFEGTPFRYATNLQHTINGNWGWRFLPQTALLYDLETTISDYPSYDPAEPSTASQLADSVRLRTRLGVNGAVTRRFSLLAMVGYGAGFYDEGAEYDSIVGQLEATYAPSQTVGFSLGYDRDFHSSFVGNFYSRDRVYAQFRLLLGGSFLLTINADVAYLDFGAALAPDGTMCLGAGGVCSRQDVRFSTRLFAEYRFTDWLATNATLIFVGDFTDFEYLRPISASMIIIDPAEYSRFEAWLGVRIFY